MTPLAAGVGLKKHWSGFGMCDGTITAIVQVESSLYPGQTRTGYSVLYPVDGTREDLEEEEVRPLLDVNMNMLAPIAAGLAKGFGYFENRITGNCQANYSCEHTYEITSLARALFDPTKAAICVPTPTEVEALVAIKPIAARDLIPAMIAELPAYLSLTACTPAGLVFNRSDVTAFTADILTWWRTNAPSIPAWATAARIVFSLQVSSAASERVFSLVENLYGQDQLKVLADQLQGATMLSYNKRAIG